MKVLVCPTDFKESLDVGQVLEAMSGGVLCALPAARITRMPVSDGGPGLLDALRSAEGGEVTLHEVTGPLGGPVKARILWKPDGEAVLEAADACGLHLVPPDERDPLRASTRGVGELLAEARRAEAARIVLGLGGSATVDGGSGMAAALGYRFLDRAGDTLPPGGGALIELARIRSPAHPPGPGSGCAVVAVTDVRTPFIGSRGAAVTFGPQKGAGPADVETLERGLTRLHERLVLDLETDVSGIPGAGAAGGLGGGCAAFLDARLVNGSDWVLERLRFDSALESADLVVTGEGAYDATSGLGKVVGEVVRRSTAARVPVLLVCGRITGDLPAGVRPVSGEGRWLDAEEVRRMVAEAVG